MMDETFSYILAIAALVIGVMLLTGHGGVFMKGGNTQARRAMPSASSLESRVGKAAASTTPSSPKPSRAAVSRVRKAESTPISAPQAW